MANSYACVDCEGMEVITYCVIGARSSHTWFVLKYLLGFTPMYAFMTTLGWSGEA